MPHKRILVGVTGKAGAGKDTAATALCKAYNAIPHSFAFRLKSMLATMLQVPYELMEGKTDESRAWREESLDGLGVSARELMLTLGTEWGRDLVHPDLWVLLVKDEWHKLTEAHRQPPGMVFSDCRFDNEAEWIRSEGGIVLEVKRNDDHVQSEKAAGHASEAGINRDLISATIWADFGDIEGLQRRAVSVVEEF